MTKTNEVTLKANGLKGISRPGGRWYVKGDGKPRVMSHDDFIALLEKRKRYARSR